MPNQLTKSEPVALSLAGNGSPPRGATPATAMLHPSSSRRRGAHACAPCQRQRATVHHASIHEYGSPVSPPHRDSFRTCGTSLSPGRDPTPPTRVLRGCSWSSGRTTPFTELKFRVKQKTSVLNGLKRPTDITLYCRSTILLGPAVELERETERQEGRRTRPRPCSTALLLLHTECIDVQCAA